MIKHYCDGCGTLVDVGVNGIAGQGEVVMEHDSFKLCVGVEVMSKVPTTAGAVMEPGPAACFGCIIAAVKQHAKRCREEISQVP